MIIYRAKGLDTVTQKDQKNGHMLDKTRVMQIYGNVDQLIMSGVIIPFDALLKPRLAVCMKELGCCITRICSKLTTAGSCSVFVCPNGAGWYLSLNQDMVGYVKRLLHEVVHHVHEPGLFVLLQGMGYTRVEAYEARWCKEWV
jgi:hypothetical protein